MSGLVCIAVHDVAPATWRRTRSLLQMVQSFGDVPVTLLVVPAYHGSTPVSEAPDFVAGIDAQCARGSEVALHGFFHLDDAAPPVAWRDRFARRVLTRGEGEFAALSSTEAGRRLAAGLAMLERCGWDVRGFVPPAWLAGDEARVALRATRLAYYTTHRRFELRDGGCIDAPVISASARSALRRGLSCAWLRCSPDALAKARVVRVALHPADAAHPSLMAAWQRALARLLATRKPVTKREAIETCT